MANQTLKTRINLKIDTLNNWLNSDLKLGEGEVAIATASSSVGSGLTEPVCVIRIGNGKQTFSELGWNFYAHAADVLTACKTEKGLTEFIDSVIANAGMATNETVGKLAERVSSIEVLKGNEETSGSVANSIKIAIDNLKLNTYLTKTEFATVKTSLEETISGVSGIANAAKSRIDTFLDTTGVANTVDTLKDIKNWMEGDGVNATELTSAIAVETSNRTSADTALSNRIKQLEDNKAGYATTAQVATAKSEAIQAAENKASTAETNAKSYASNLTNLYATAAQGVKADNALSSITTTSNKGLKITGNNKIDIDTDVVFVFTCGNASTELNDI